MSEELPGPLAGAACTEVTLIRPLKWGRWHGAAVTDEGEQRVMSPCIKRALNHKNLCY